MKILLIDGDKQMVNMVKETLKVFMLLMLLTLDKKVKN